MRPLRCGGACRDTSPQPSPDASATPPSPETPTRSARDGCPNSRNSSTQTSSNASTQALVAGAGQRARPRSTAGLADRSTARRHTGTDSHRRRLQSRHVGRHRRMSGPDLAHLDRTRADPGSGRSRRAARSASRRPVGGSRGRPQQHLRGRPRTGAHPRPGSRRATPPHTQLDSNEHQDATIDRSPTQAAPDSEDQWFVEPDLTVASLIRDLGATPLALTDAEIREMHRRAEEWDDSPVSRERAVEINAMARDFFETAFTGSWGQHHLAERVSVDLAGHEHFHPVTPPQDGGIWSITCADTASPTKRCSAWASQPQRRAAISSIDSGTAWSSQSRTTARSSDSWADATPTSRRDQARRPQVPEHRRHPALPQGRPALRIERRPLGRRRPPGPCRRTSRRLGRHHRSAGQYLGLAPLGTSLTDNQARQLATIKRATGHDPIVATDADVAGRAAAERDFWMLTPHGLDPAYARLPRGLDPADLMIQEGPAALTAALLSARPLGEHLLSERLLNLAPEQASQGALRVLAAQQPGAWTIGAEKIATHLGLEHRHIRRELRDAVRAWDLDPHRIAHSELARGATAGAELQADALTSPARRWAPVALTVDPRLVSQPDWPATADALQLLHDHGRDVDTAIRTAIGQIHSDQCRPETSATAWPQSTDTPDTTGCLQRTKTQSRPVAP